MYKKPTIIKIEKIIDERGQLNFFEIDKDIDFLIKRVYFISNVAKNKERGQHAHKKLKQLMIAVGGAVEIDLDDGLGNKFSFVLNSSSEALYIPCGYWRVLKFFDQNTNCFVFASQKYDTSDYIRNYQEFVEYKKIIE